MIKRLGFLEKIYSWNICSDYVHNMFIVWSFVHNLFRFGAMIKSAKQLKYRKE